MESLLKEITELHKDMESLTLLMGVPKSYYEAVVAFKGDVIEKELQARCDWLFHVRHHEYFEVLKIWRLLPPSIWQHYEDLGIHNLREQELLRVQRKQLRSIWKKWYYENVSDRKADQDRTPRSGVQSEASGTDGSSGIHERPIVLREQGHRVDCGSQGSGEAISSE